ncbi:unnamed protein product [Bursaphelenchus xylophilus]|uniref:(pine wood nematode) hypothetical protein n=1 Tax=Bursaphelenchus xylophilus TaxID=6326 RepID=A0A1I7SCB8_BURXY|nr:unnamed protein product [Bursaphelenchus xylophilus]CAG9094398.1 unnamed protein product [Bursaphelenchus xylophilus]
MSWVLTRDCRGSGAGSWLRLLAPALFSGSERLRLSYKPKVGRQRSSSLLQESRRFLRAATGLLVVAIRSYLQLASCLTQFPEIGSARSTMAVPIVRKRPMNHPLWFITTIEFVTMIYSLNALLHDPSLARITPEFGNWGPILHWLQYVVLIFSIFTFSLFFKRSWLRSYGYGRSWRNRFRHHVCGFFALLLTLVAITSTILWPGYFKDVGLYFTLLAKSFFFLFFLYWRRENLIEQYVEEMMHVNGSSSILLTSQNIRDMYKLFECDNEFITYADAWPIFCSKHKVQGIRQSEYYHLQKWLHDLAGYMDNGGPVDDLYDIMKEMQLRCEFFDVQKSEQRRYQQLAALQNIIRIDPINLGQSMSRTINRDSSYLVHEGQKIEELV